ncbi:MAG: outer membrane beta-barrel protein [Gammaproteobacteria bacterium]|nr:outer membrane beta-barrel protein [Gammaproteobacteria bacterium]
MKLIHKFVFASLLFFSTHSYSVEIIPLLGFRAGGEFIDDTTDKKHTLESSEAYGLILSFPYERGKNIEIYYSHQSTKLNSITINNQPAPNSSVDIPLTIDYLHIGGTAPISDEKNLKTFVSGGLGFTYSSLDYAGAQSDLRASFSIGVGLKWPMTERISLQLEARGLATLYNNNSAIYCNGGCAISVNGNLFLQGEVFAGLGFRF